MTGSVGVHLSPDGRPEAVKFGDPDRLEAEHRRLRALADAPVVRALAAPLGCELRLAWAGSATLATIRPVGHLGLEHLAAAVEALGELHRHGVAHGQVRAEHAIVTASGSIVWCGLSAGRPLTDTLRLDDVEALAALVDDWQPGGAGADTGNQAAADLLANAPLDQVAGDLRAAAGHHRHGSSDTRAAPRVRVRQLAAIGVAALVAIGLTTVRPTSDRAADRPATRSSRPTTTTVASVAPTTTTQATPPSTASQVWPRPVRPTTCTREASPSGAMALVPGASCPEPASVDGRTVSIGTERYEVGVAGDTVVLGDWDCDGLVTPALLRPTTGEVFVFDDWATAEIEAIDGVRGTRLEVRHLGTCDRLGAVAADGTILTVPGTGS